MSQAGVSVDAQALPFSLWEKVPPYSAAEEGSPAIWDGPHPPAKTRAPSPTGREKGGNTFVGSEMRAWHLPPPKQGGSGNQAGHEPSRPVQ